MLKGAEEERLLGKWFLIHALEEAGSGRAFYPELLYQTDFPSARLITGDKVLRRLDAKWPTEMGDGRPKRMSVEETLLYDMESTAVFQSANAFLSLENLFFLRCSTDFGIGENGSRQLENGKTVPEMLREQMRKEEEKVFSFLSNLERLDAEKEKESLFSKKEGRRMSSLSGQAGRTESAFRFHGVASNSGKAGKAG